MMKEIAIIGAGGNMGYWFSKYFSNRKGIRLSVYDINLTSLKDSNDAIVCYDIGDCVKTADLVLVCVPIKNTPSTIEECASNMKSGAILAEISSVKHRVFRVLKKVSKNVEPLCIHPMFGPGTVDIKQMKILLIPVKNQENELRTLNDLFEEATVIVIPNADIHDKLIAIVLGLTHYTNTVFASFLSTQNFSYLKKVAGTTFEIQSLLAASILTEEPDLIISLLIENRTVRKYIQSYLNEANKVATLVFDENDVDLRTKYIKTKSILQQQENLQLSYKRMYNIIERFKQQDFL